MEKINAHTSGSKDTLFDQPLIKKSKFTLKGKCLDIYLKDNRKTACQ